LCPRVCYSAGLSKRFEDARRLCASLAPDTGSIVQGRVVEPLGAGRTIGTAFDKASVLHPAATGRHRPSRRCFSRAKLGDTDLGRATKLRPILGMVLRNRATSGIACRTSATQRSQLLRARHAVSRRARGRHRSPRRDPRLAQEHVGLLERESPRGSVAALCDGRKCGRDS
jgi:hypothetical protein